MCWPTCVVFHNDIQPVLGSHTLQELHHHSCAQQNKTSLPEWQPPTSALYWWSALIGWSKINPYKKILHLNAESVGHGHDFGIGGLLLSICSQSSNDQWSVKQAELIGRNVVSEPIHYPLIWRWFNFLLFFNISAIICRYQVHGRGNLGLDVCYLDIHWLHRKPKDLWVPPGAILSSHDSRWIQSFVKVYVCCSLPSTLDPVTTVFLPSQPINGRCHSTHTTLSHLE